MPDGRIGDFVWFDVDGNGIYDEGEEGVGRVEVYLYLDNGDGVFDNPFDNPASEDEYLLVVLTDDETGMYLFEGLPPGNYWVEVYAPAFVNTTPNYILVELGYDEVYLDADFGLWFDIG